ncbi:hypothetical protein GCM10027446_31040 [Angustibacter peucedani]
MSGLVERAAARLLCLDPDGAVLVQAVVDPAEPDVVRWVSPGGGVEAGETAEQAAVREAWEELGLHLDDLGEPAVVMSNEFGYDGQRYLGHNTFYAVRTARFDPVPAGMTAAELSFTRGQHWLTADELDDVATRGEVVSPPAMSAWVRRLHGELDPAPVRPTVRVLVVDPDDRVLLMRARASDGARFWFPPGGGVEPGETMRAAACRELREELGLDVREQDLGPCVWTRRHLLGGPGAGRLDLRERWHLLRVAAFAPDRAGWTDLEVSTIDALRWWTADELRATDDVLTPSALPDLLPRLLDDERAGRLEGAAPREVDV